MSKKKLAKIFYADLWGVRQDKYKYLFKNDAQTTKWKKIKPLDPYYFFVPKDFALEFEYDKLWKLTDIFKEWGSGIITRRDNLTIAFNKHEQRNKMLMFSNLKLPDDIIHKTFKIENTKEWNLNSARNNVKGEKIEELIKEYHYRPFDFRYIYYSDSVVSRTCKKWMKHILSDNIALLSTRVITNMEEKGSFISTSLGDIHIISGQSYFFPLFLYLEKFENQLFGDKKYKANRVSNFIPAFMQAIKESLGKEPAPEEIFSYIYAVLYSPSYRKRYEEFLKIDFPRIPLPANRQFFQKLTKLGQELIDLHLLKHPSLSATEIGVPKSGSNTVDMVKYEDKTKRVYFNKNQYFENIARHIWEYRIGSYQVMDKYLKDRKGRKLSLDEINHYLKMSKAIRLTIKLQENIDRIWKAKD